MGYTHYWYVKGPLDQGTWDEFKGEAQDIVREAQANGIRVRGSLGDGEPTFGSDRIALNGDNDRNQDYESFIVTRKGSGQIADYGEMKGKGFSFDCCKTQYRPYDEVVVAILISLATHFPDTVIVRSDGSAPHGEFDQGVDLYQRTTGKSCNVRRLINRDENDMDEDETLPSTNTDFDDDYSYEAVTQYPDLNTYFR